MIPLEFNNDGEDENATQELMLILCTQLIWFTRLVKVANDV